ARTWGALFRPGAAPGRLPGWSCPLREARSARCTGLVRWGGSRAPRLRAAAESRGSSCELVLPWRSASGADVADVDLRQRPLEQHGREAVQLPVEAIAILDRPQRFPVHLGLVRAIGSDVARRQAVERPVECAVKEDQRFLEALGQADHRELREVGL